MGILTLHELINLNRDEIIRRCGTTAAPQATGHWMNQGADAFLDQLLVELRDGRSGTETVNEAVMPGGVELTSQMGAVPEVTPRYYRGVGPAVVDLALELNVPMSADDCLMLDRSLDAAIAHAVTQHVRRRTIASDRAVNTLQDLTDTAIAAFEVLQTGAVGVIGRTGTLVLRSLREIRARTEQTT